MASSFTRFLDHTQRRTTVGRIPLDEWSARRRDLYRTTHDTYNRQTSIPPVGFEPTISVGERPQTYALDRAATGTGFGVTYLTYIIADISIVIFTTNKSSNTPPLHITSGFGGLEVACWPLVSKFAGSHPAEAFGFLGRKKSSARLPSDGKQSRRSHVM